MLSLQRELFHYVVQYSGGIGSFAAAHNLIAGGGIPRERVTLLFCDTKTEDEDLYRFLQQSTRYLGLWPTVIADGRNFWELARDRRVIPNSQRDTCSETLKRNLARSYLLQNHPPATTVLVFGIDWMEAHRAASIRRRWWPYTCRFPLIGDKGYDKNEFTSRMEAEWGIKKPRLYDMGFPHNNCGGFCVKAGKAQFLLLLEKLPERYRYHEENELAMQQYLGKPYTILRETVKKTRRYISLQELRERAEEIRATEEGQCDWGGCACFT